MLGIALLYIIIILFLSYEQHVNTVTCFIMYYVLLLANKNSVTVLSHCAVAGEGFLSKVECEFIVRNSCV